MSLVLNESLVLAKTRSQDLKSVLQLNCWNSGIKDVSLVRQLINVEVIGLSCNEVTTLEDFAYCRKLKALILRQNKIKNIAEIAHLQGLPKLTSLWLGENPCAETTHNYRKVVLKALPNLTVLDNVPVTKEELQEIEELGNEIYEEVPYESSNSSGSGPSSNQRSEYEVDRHSDVPVSNSDIHLTATNNNNNVTEPINEASFFQPNDISHDISINAQASHLNDSHFNSSLAQKTPMNVSRSSMIPQQQLQQHRCLSSQGSVTTLNGLQHQSWSMSTNNNILPKGGKNRNANILSAVLCLVKELDYTSCEVVQTALHCRMEETFQ